MRNKVTIRNILQNENDLIEVV